MSHGDGRRHHATPLVYPIHHQPGASHAGTVYNRALHAAYAVADLEPTIVLSQAAGIDLTDVYNFVNRDFVLSNSVVPIAEGYREIRGTHLVAVITYLVLDNGEQNALAYHKLSAISGLGTVNTSVQSEQVSPQGERGSPEERATRRREAWNAATDYVFGNPEVQSTRIELALTTDQIGQLCRVVVSGCAALDGTTELGYWAQSVVVFQESR